MGRRKIYNDPVDRRRERYKARQRAEFDAYRSACRCVICGVLGTEAPIEFYNPDPTIKDHNIGRMIVQGHSWRNVQLEIANTLPVCRSCHDDLRSGLTEIPAASELDAGPADGTVSEAI